MECGYKKVNNVQEDILNKKDIYTINRVHVKQWNQNPQSFFIFLQAVPGQKREKIICQKRN